MFGWMNDRLWTSNAGAGLRACPNPNVGAGPRACPIRPDRAGTGARPYMAAPLLVFALALAGCGYSTGSTSSIDTAFCHGITDGTPCDDGDPCTIDDRCGLGICLGEPTDEALACDDGNPCTEDDACVAGACAGIAVAGELTCDDGDPCTQGGQCKSGRCVAEPKDCSSLDAPCAAGACDPATGACRALPLPDGALCDDGDPCTRRDACQGGFCAGGEEACGCLGREDGAACDDQDPCTSEDVCADEVCAGTAMDCHDLDEGCRVGRCDPATGACAEVVAADGAPCDDGDACTEEDACEGGECRGLALTCEGMDEPCMAVSCDPEVGACLHEPAADGEPCDDGDPCTQDEVCLAGLCLSDVNLCACQELPDGAPCDDGDGCTDFDACAGGACQGVPASCPAPEDDCLLGACDPVSGECVVVAAADGSPCDDENPCTEDEICLAGACQGQDICACADAPEGTACDDADPCTVDDACDAGGFCVGAAMDCATLDVPCMLGVCDPVLGACAAIPRDNGLTCDDGQICTSGDQCQLGLCVGTPADCSPLDTACGVGACEEETGACVSEPLADDTPCDDGDPCTGHDDCQAGVCLGEIPLCGPCQGLSAGDPCDDGDPCTEAEACALVEGALGCQGATRDCSPLDGPCQLGACDASSGACLALPRPDGAACEDGDPCTHQDACDQGLCLGAPVPTCGATPTGCEHPGDNDTAGHADPIELVDGAAELLGRIEPAGETDWYEVALLPGQRVDLAVLPHCGGALDTLLGLYAPGDATVLAYDDDGGGELGSTLSFQGIQAAAPHLIAVTAYSDSGAGSYRLQIQVAVAEPCATDADCACAEQACLLPEGEASGQCAPAMPAATEPDDKPAQAQAMTLGAEILGDLGTVDDEDWYLVELPASVGLTLETRRYCYLGADTRIRLYAADGHTQIAGDDDSGGFGMGRIEDLVLAEAGPHYVQVSGEHASAGPYVLSVFDTPCFNDADCGCADQICEIGEGGGLCVPANTAPDSSDDAPLALTLGQRLHARIDPHYDADVFEITLQPGVYDLRTEAFCGEALDTRLTLLDGDGAVLLEDEDSGEGLFAAVLGWEVTQETTLLMKVRAHGAEVGDYVVVVTGTN